MTAPQPPNPFRRHDPREPDAVRVENRSDRVWVFGYVRMVPGLLFVGTIIAMVILMNYGPPIPLPLAFAIGVGAVAIPLALDRSTVLDPVDFVLLGKEWVHVKRLAGRRNYPIARVRVVEWRRPSGEDYDERQKLRRYAEVTIRFSGTWSAARLMISEREAGLVNDWVGQGGVRLDRVDDRGP